MISLSRMEIEHQENEFLKKKCALLEKQNSVNEDTISLLKRIIEEREETIRLLEETSNLKSEKDRLKLEIICESALNIIFTSDQKASEETYNFISQIREFLGSKKDEESTEE
jgi:predicted nucleotidyltransferase